jgi:hypothetical protein
MLIGKAKAQGQIQGENKVVQLLHLSLDLGVGVR